MASLRQLVLQETSQDVRRCQACLDCDAPGAEDMDIPLGTMVQMVLYDDEEVLTSRTLWSESVLKVSSKACHRGIDLSVIIEALRKEAFARGIVLDYGTIHGS